VAGAAISPRPAIQRATSQCREDKSFVSPAPPPSSHRAICCAAGFAASGLVPVVPALAACVAESCSSHMRTKCPKQRSGLHPPPIARRTRAFIAAHERHSGKASGLVVPAGCLNLASDGGCIVEHAPLFLLLEQEIHATIRKGNARSECSRRHYPDGSRVFLAPLREHPFQIQIETLPRIATRAPLPLKRKSNVAELPAQPFRCLPSCANRNDKKSSKEPLHPSPATFVKNMR